MWFPATPGWGPSVVLVGARSPPLAVGPGVPFSLALVCVCVLCGASCWCGWRWGVWLPYVCVCACGVWFVGCVIPWLVPVVVRHGCGQKAEETQKKGSCRCVAEMLDMRNAKYIPLYLSDRAFFPLYRESVCRPPGGWLGVGRVRWSYLSSSGSCFSFSYLVLLRVEPCVSPFFLVASSITYLFALCFPYREGVQGGFFFCGNILAAPRCHPL